jgi:integrating conjugative element membrane protein (TIGR03747 family)
MADPAAVAQHQQARSQGLILGILTLPLRLLGVLCGSLLLSIVIECLGVLAIWPEQSWHHAQRMLEYEVDHLSARFIQSIVLSDPVKTADHLLVHAYDRIFLKSGLMRWAQNANSHVGTVVAPPQGMKRFLTLSFDSVAPFALAAGYTILTFLVRLIVLCLTVPLFLVSALIGLVDGLVRRDIRRFGAGYESGFVHHRVKAMVVPIAVLPWVLYLALPVSVHPLFVLLPGAMLLSVTINIAAGTFKKYL